MSARTMLQMGEVAVGALEAIEKLTHLGGPKAEAALVAIRAVLSALDDGFDGKVSPQAALSQIESLQHAIAQNDATVIAELVARFKTP